jgi:hypothetical protein
MLLLASSTPPLTLSLRIGALMRAEHDPLGAVLAHHCSTLLPLKESATILIRARKHRQSLNEHVEDLKRTDRIKRRVITGGRVVPSRHPWPEGLQSGVHHEGPNARARTRPQRSP